MRWWVVVALAGCEPEEAVDTGRQVEAFPRCEESDPLKRPFFGDTHVHTALSLDANLQGTRLSPGDAYRFAKGEEVGIQPYDAGGNALRHLRIDRPLDFLVVSDHSEFLGTVALCTTEGSPAWDSAECVRYREDPDLAFVTINAYTAAPQDDAAYPDLCGADGGLCKEAGLDVWTGIREAAEAAYDRTDACTFTSFVGYEWSGGPGTKNLHRNVIFRHDRVPDVPLSYFDAARPEDLWDGLDAGCLDEPPCDVLTIPHNSNLSGGLMFETFDEGADAAQSARRARMEPLVEVFQHKGASECLPGALGSDELCGFEVVPYASLSQANLDVEGTPLPQDFVRTMLGEGLRFEDAVGENPYAWGFVASTDTHLGTGGAASEAGYPGHGGAGSGARDEVPVGLPDLVTFNPGGLAVLWAEENTRESLFRAMRRKEAYGTSGPRIVLRVFGGWDYPADLCDAVDLEAQGYAGGVPMGGTLPGSGEAPRLVVAALADPGTEDAPGTPLQRLQVVKGWLDGDTVHTEVIDVAGGPDGAGVDAACNPTGGGSARLCAVWTDPAFDPSALAFYYVRAVEDPSCRWQERACRAAGVTCPVADPAWAGCCDERVPGTIQERAWSSPIWYLPGG